MFSIQIGRGGSGPDYPLRTFVRDEQERLRAEREQQEREQQERDRAERDEVEPEGRENEAASKDRGRDGARGRERERPAADEARGGPSQSEGDVPYLLGEDSPLLLQNIPDYVIDTEPAIEAIKARLGEGGRVSDRSERLFDQLGKALYPSELPPHVDAELLSHRLRAFAVLDGEYTRWLAGYYGAGGKDRVFYSILTSPDRLLTNREIKLPLLRLFAEEFPMSRIIGNIHADTDHKHCHVWMSARLANQLKLHMGWEDVGGVRVNRYKGVDERYLVNYCAVVGDPQPLATHLEKKAEWNERKALVMVALAKGERPPALPFRERLPYDELGERRQRRERRAREENGEDPGPKKRAAPVARLKSSWECAELWGKTEHARARLADARHRRDAFERASRHVEVEVDGHRWSLHRIEEERGLPGRQREGKEEALGRAERERREAELRAVEAKVLKEVEASRQLLAREVEEHELDYGRHDEAWKKTIENRKKEKLPEIKYPLHNVRQLDEMRGIAERTRDADLLRYVREYDLLDRPEGRDELRREFAERWAREITAEAGVHEEGQRLRASLRDEPALRPDDSEGKGRGDARDRAAEDRMLGRLFDEWAKGGWTTEEVRQSLACVRDERLRQQAWNYLRAREYHEATKEVLRDYRVGAEGVVAPPTLRPDEIEKIKELLSEKDAVLDKQARTHLDKVVEFASGEARVSPEGVRRMVERSLFADGSLSRADSRAASATEKFDVARPLDDRWSARLTDIVALVETRALAAGMRETSVEKLEAVRREAVERREMLEFVGWVRDHVGLAEPSPVRVPTDERRELEDLRRYVSQQLLRERPWTREQVEQINDFGHRAPEENREGLAEALNDARQRLDRPAVVRAERPQESPARADGRHAPADSRRPVTETEVPPSRSGVVTKEQSVTINQDTAREGSHEGRGHSSADRAETAERLRVAWILAAADSPSVARLQSRFAAAGVEVEVRGGEEGGPVSAVRLKCHGESFDARSLDGRADVSKISRAKDSVIYQDKERAVEKCLEMALLSRAEQDRRLSLLTNRGGPLKTDQVDDIHRTKYALLAVAAVRSGAASDWAGIDKQIAGMPKPKALEKLDGEWLARTWGVGRLVELEKTGQRGAPVPMIRPMIPDRSPTRPSHDPTRDRTNRPGGGGSGRSSRGGR
ncbi:MAG TPA: hypothetical protein VNZ44_10705 [Pyrinomonadaceae bacterium]|nr:hypothetical protein [Pyrinomonadaceae bacterium]